MVLCNMSNATRNELVGPMQQENGPKQLNCCESLVRCDGIVQSNSSVIVCSLLHKQFFF